MPLRNEFGAYGRTDLAGVDLSTSDDFDPTMMVGYDDVKNLFYVAVIVRDDELYMDGDPIYRDGIEIYLSDLSSGGRPVQHRIATSRHGQDNPRQGDVQSAWSNEGDHLVYEWQGSIADGRRRLVLDEGGIFGLDVVAIDNDGDGHTAWYHGGPRDVKNVQ